MALSRRKKVAIIATVLFFGYILTRSYFTVRNLKQEIADIEATRSSIMTTFNELVLQYDKEQLSTALPSWPMQSNATYSLPGKAFAGEPKSSKTNRFSTRNVFRDSSNS
jgi:hypothetical protein